MGLKEIIAKQVFNDLSESINKRLKEMEEKNHGILEEKLRTFEKNLRDFTTDVIKEEFDKWSKEHKDDYEDNKTDSQAP